VNSKRDREKYHSPYVDIFCDCDPENALCAQRYHVDYNILDAELEGDVVFFYLS
jgi:hypothetical protein